MWDSIEKCSDRVTPGSPSGPRGITLTGVLYGVILVGILVGIALPFIDVDRFRMNSAATEIASELLAAQRFAVLRGHDVVVAFDERSSQVRTHLDSNNDGLIQTQEGSTVLHLQGGVTFGRGEGLPLTASTQTVSFNRRQGLLKAVTFHRNGSASEPGVVYLTIADDTDPTGNRAIEVIRKTADVKCWSYGSGIWEEGC